MAKRTCKIVGIARNGIGGDTMVDGNSSCHEFAASSSEEIARMAHAEVKNIAGDNQATLTVDQNYAIITQSFEIYVYEIATDAPQLTAASEDR